MFDANLRHLPKGTWFFAKVYNAKGRVLSAFGLQPDDIVVAHMLSDDHENPSITIYHKGKHITVDDQIDSYKSMLVYEGNFDLTGFIKDESLEKAKLVKLEYTVYQQNQLIKKLQNSIHKAANYLIEGNDDAPCNALCALEEQ